MDELDKAINPKPGERWLTRGGHIARLYADDGAEPFVLHGAVGDKDGWSPETWTRDGRAGRVPVSGLDLIRRYDWREELAPIWAVLKPEYRFMGRAGGGEWRAFTHKPRAGLATVDGRIFVGGINSVGLSGLHMPTPDCPWYETLTERPEGV